MKFTVALNLPSGELFQAITDKVGRFLNMTHAEDWLEVLDEVSLEEQGLIQTAAAEVAAIDWPTIKAKSAALSRIDAEAEAVRSKYLTSAPLQAATYINKARDALAYKQANYPEPFNPALYPYVDSEMRAAGDTLAKDAADRILYEASIYDSVKGAAIEYERRKGKIDVSAANTVEDINAALNATISGLQAL